MSQRQKVDDERLRNRRCGIDNCPSKRYFRIDGRIVCDRGHEQNFLETAEDDEAPTSSMKVHKFDSQDGPRRRKEGPKALTSEENEVLYLECYRYVLQGHIKALISLGLPEELEGVVKDLWGLYISTLNLKVPSITNVKQETEDDLSDDEMSILKEQESSEEEESYDEPRHRKMGEFRSDIQQLKRYPTLILSPLFSYLAITALRVPVYLNEIYQWIIEEKVPFTLSDKLVPAHMLRRLHARTQHRFTITTKLQPSYLHYWTRQLANLYQQSFGITFPSLNYPPLLYKYATALSLPFETHALALRLISFISISSFSVSENEKWKRTGGYAESKLLAFLIIACRLGYDLENTGEWKSWAEPCGNENDGHLTRGKCEDVTEQDILEMTDEQLDKYMDWIQNTYIEEDDGLYANKRIPEGILSMFSLKKTALNLPKPQETSFDHGDCFNRLCPRAGEWLQKYTIYHAEAKLPTVLSRLVQRGAKLVGVTEETLRYSIRWLEFKLFNVGRGMETQD